MSEAAPPPPRRNPPWNRDETILAFDLFMRRRPTLPGQEDPEIIALSRLLNAYSTKMGLTGDERMRNANGVSMKVANLSRHDPNDSRKGLSHGASLEIEVWQEFSDHADELAATADAIRRAIGTGESVSDLRGPDEDAGALEGRILSRFHVERERKPGIAQRKRRRVLEMTGRLACECCAFDFSSIYGERGSGFAEVHHTRPLHLIDFGTKTRLEDLAVLCANCHRMIHTKRPWLTVPQLRGLIANIRSSHECATKS